MEASKVARREKQGKRGRRGCGRALETAPVSALSDTGVSSQQGRPGSRGGSSGVCKGWKANCRRVAGEW